MRSSHNLLFAAQSIDKAQADRRFTTLKEAAGRLGMQWWLVSERYALSERRADLLLNCAEIFGLLGNRDGAARALRAAFSLHPCSRDGWWKPEFLDYDLNSVPNLREVLEKVGYPKPLANDNK
jgi:hypothetical protein